MEGKDSPGFPADWPEYQYLDTEHGKLAYVSTQGEGPRIFCISGHTDTMGKFKAGMQITNWCREQGMPVTAFDYGGWGASEGEPKEWQLDLWLQNILDVLDQVIEEPCIFLGHSMGGYLALAAAVLRPDRVKGIIAIAPGFGGSFSAPGSISCAGQNVLEIVCGRNGNELANTINIDCPVRVLHGLADTRVPWHASINVAQKVSCGDIQVRLIKEGTHQMPEKSAQREIQRTIMELVNV